MLQTFPRVDSASARHAAIIDRSIDSESAVSSLMTMGKLMSSEALEDFARQIARLHRLLRRDWDTRFGLSEATVHPAAT